MIFRARYSLATMQAAVGSPIEVHVDDVSVTVGHSPHPHTAEQDVTLVTARQETEPPASIAAGLRAFAASDAPLNERPLPDHVRAFSLTTGQALSDAARRVVELLRWLECSEMPHGGYVAFAPDWSEDEGQTWLPLPAEYGGYSYGLPPLILNKPVTLKVQAMVRAGQVEPMAHSLLREAYDVCHNNPRSALVLGVAAGRVLGRGV